MHTHPVLWHHRQHQIDRFVELLRSKQDVRYMQLVSKLCCPNGVDANRANQMMILRQLKHKKCRSLLPMTQFENLNHQGNQLAMWWPKRARWLALSTLEQEDRAVHTYYRGMLSLFCALCVGDNREAISFVTSLFGASHIKHCLGNETTYSHDIKTVFVGLLLNAFIPGRKDHKIIHNLMRVDMITQHLLEGWPDVSALSDEAVRRFAAGSTVFIKPPRSDVNQAVVHNMVTRMLANQGD